MMRHPGACGDDLLPLDGVLMLDRIGKEQRREAMRLLRGGDPVPPRS